MSQRPVVVGYDGSTEATAAVQWAALEANRRTAPLIVVHATGFARGANLPPARAALADLMQQSYEQLAAEGVEIARTAAPQATVTGEVRYGPARHVLTTASNDAALLVVGNRGAGLFVGGMLGSVAFAVTSRATCPVVVVRGDAVAPLGPQRPVVVGYDGSGHSSEALAQAFQFAAAANTPVTVLTAWTVSAEEQLAGAQWAQMFPDEPMGQHARIQAEQAQAAARTWQQQEYPNLDVTWKVAEGPATRVLVEASNSAGLLVTGVRGRGTVASALLGSVSRGVTHRSQCPVMVVKAAGEVADDK